MRNKKNNFKIIGSLILSVFMLGLMFTSCDGPSTPQYTVAIKAGDHVSGATITATVTAGESLSGKFKQSDLDKFVADDCYVIEGVKKEGESTVTAIADILTTLDSLTVEKDLTYEVTAKRTHYKVTITRGEHVKAFSVNPSLIGFWKNKGVTFKTAPGVGVNKIIVKFEKGTNESLSSKFKDSEWNAFLAFDDDYEYDCLVNPYNNMEISFTVPINKDITYQVRAKKIGKNKVTIVLAKNITISDKVTLENAGIKIVGPLGSDKQYGLEAEVVPNATFPLKTNDLLKCLNLPTGFSNLEFYTKTGLNNGPVVIQFDTYKISKNDIYIFADPK